MADLQLQPQPTRKSNSGVFPVIDQEAVAADLAREKAKSQGRFGNNLADQARLRQEFPIRSQGGGRPIFEDLSGDEDEAEDEDIDNQYTNANITEPTDRPGAEENNETANYQDEQSQGEPPAQTENEAEPEIPAADVQAEAKTQLDQEGQKRAAAEMAGSKDATLLRIAKQRAQLEKELAELGEQLRDFQNGSVLGWFGLFRHTIDRMINRIIEEAKKPLKNLSDEAKRAKLIGLVGMLYTFIGALEVMRLFASALDAIIVSPWSSIRMIILTLPTIILPILFILIAPIHIIFLAIFYFIGKIPLFKGPLSKQIIEIIDKVKKKITVFKEEIKKLGKKIQLRKQISQLNQMEKQVRRGQMDPANVNLSQFKNNTSQINSRQQNI